MLLYCTINLKMLTAWFCLKCKTIVKMEIVNKKMNL